jgi:AcrR family transcriptional regulator
MVEREGTGAVSLSEAARRVGVSPQASYNHFRDKSELLAAAAEEAVRGFERSMRAASDTAPSEGARFEAVGVAYVTFASEHPARLRLLSAPELADKHRHPALLAAYEDAFGVLLGAIAECQRALVVRPGDSRELAVAAWGMVHGIAWLIVDGQIGVVGEWGEPAHTARRAVRALFKGLSARN